MGRELGIPPAMAKQGAYALLPAILGGFKKQAQSGGGAADGLGGLGGLLGQLGGGGLLDSVLAPQPTPVNQGNEVLGQIFGSKDVSRTVAGQAAAQIGLAQGILKQKLPMLAMTLGRESCRERVCQYAQISGDAGHYKNKPCHTHIAHH